MLLSVKFSGPYRFTIECQKNELVQDIVQKLAKAVYQTWKIDSDEILLKASIEGNYLDNSLNLEFYEIQNGDTLFGFFKNGSNEIGDKLNLDTQSNPVYELSNEKSKSPPQDENFDQIKKKTPDFISDLQEIIKHTQDSISKKSNLLDMAARKTIQSPSIKDDSQIGSEACLKKMKKLGISLGTIDEDKLDDYDDDKKEKNEKQDLDGGMSFEQGKNQKSSPKTPKKGNKAKVSFVIGEPSYHPEDYTRMMGGAPTEIHHTSINTAANQTQERGTNPIVEPQQPINAQGPYSLLGQENAKKKGVPNITNLQTLIDAIVEMGFEPSLAKKALIQADYDKEMALNLILNDCVENPVGDYSGVSHDSRNQNERVIYSDPIIGPQLPYDYQSSGQPAIRDIAEVSVLNSPIKEINQNRFFPMIPFEITQTQTEEIEPLLKDNEFQAFKETLKMGKQFSFPQFLEFLGTRFPLIYDLFITNPELMKIALTENFSSIENNINSQEEGLNEIDRANIESVF